jgi:integrase
MGTIRNILRIDKPLKSGKCPVDLIYQVSGQRKFYRTDLKLYRECWDDEKQKAVYLDKKEAKKLLPAVQYDLLPTHQDIEEANSALKILADLIGEIEKRYKMDKIPFSSEMVINQLKEKTKGSTKKEEKSNVLFEFMQKYIDDHKNTRSRTSLSVYKSVKNRLENFSKTTGRKVTFENIDYSFFQAFQNFLLQDQKILKSVKGEMKEVTVKGLNNTTVAKQLSTIKTFLNYAKTQGVEVTDKYKDFKIKRENLEVIALTSEEFEVLYNLDLSDNKRLAQIRDVFCFACTTGLRYSDLAQLKREHIRSDEIRLTVTKTKEILMIPLNPYSKAILAKYEEVYRPLPVISNQNLNYGIKDLCKLAAINEPVEIVRFRGAKRESITYPKFELIGVHTGRRTFVTLSLEKGMSAEEVMSITGHKEYKSFKRYVNVTEKRKKVVMVKAWGHNVSESKLKAV